jgi:hypothetical protein
MDETSLIQAARQGDLDSFNRLVLAYQDIVYGRLRILGEPSRIMTRPRSFISAYPT